MDILSRIFASVLLILLSPFLILISILSLMYQGRPIIYKQERVGINFIPFTIYKFRSMCVSSDGINSFSTGEKYKATKWGNFIRQTKIDEIPQLYNIIRGDMSFIGPRPELLEFVNYSSFKYLDKIKPGLSCYSTILFRDESQNFEFINSENSYEQVLKIKTCLDNYYLNKKSIREDLKLILLTVLSIFFPKLMTRLFIDYYIKLYNQNKFELSNDIDKNIQIQVDADSKNTLLGSNIN